MIHNKQSQKLQIYEQTSNSYDVTHSIVRRHKCDMTHSYV